MWNRPNASPDSRIAAFSPYLRVRSISCLRNSHSSKIGPTITRKTTFQIFVCMARSETRSVASPLDSAIDSMLPTTLPSHIIGRHMSSNLKNRPGFMSNLRVSMTVDLPMSITATGMAIRYSGTPEPTYVTQFGTSPLPPATAYSALSSTVASAYQMTTIRHRLAPILEKSRRARCSHSTNGLRYGLLRLSIGGCGDCGLFGWYCGTGPCWYCGCCGNCGNVMVTLRRANKKADIQHCTTSTLNISLKSHHAGVSHGERRLSAARLR